MQCSKHYTELHVLSIQRTVCTVYAANCVTVYTANCVTVYTANCVYCLFSKLCALYIQRTVWLSIYSELCVLSIYSELCDCLCSELCVCIYCLYSELFVQSALCVLRALCSVCTLYSINVYTLDVHMKYTCTSKLRVFL